MIELFCMLVRSFLFYGPLPPSLCPYIQIIYPLKEINRSSNMLIASFASFYMVVN